MLEPPGETLPVRPPKTQLDVGDYAEGAVIGYTVAAQGKLHLPGIEGHQLDVAFGGGMTVPS